MNLTYFRILEEQGFRGTTVYRIQRRGWWRWRDERVINHFNPHGPSLTSILRFDKLEDARAWIDDKCGKLESAKRVLETYAVYG